MSIDKEKKRIFRKDSLSIDGYSLWLQEVTRDSTKTRYKVCLKTFSVHAHGKSTVDKHRIGNAHLKSMKSSQNNPALAQFITPKMN